MTRRAIQDRTTLQVAGRSGQLGNKPVVVGQNGLGSIEIGAYRLTNDGFAFTVVLVEAAYRGEPLDLEAFRLASFTDEPMDRERRAVVAVEYPGGIRASTLGERDAAGRKSPLVLSTPFGLSGAGSGAEGGSVRPRANGDRIVQHGIIVNAMPEAIAELRRTEATLAALWTSRRLQDWERASEVGPTLRPVSQTAQIEVEWPEIDLHAEVGLEIAYSPDLMSVLPSASRGYDNAASL